MPHSITFELIEKLAAQEKSQLQDDALRTIRQKDPEKGMAILNQMEGIERFVRALERTFQSSYYKQLGYIQDDEKAKRSRAAVQPIRKKGAQ